MWHAEHTIVALGRFIQDMMLDFVYLKISTSPTYVQECSGGP